VPRKKNAKDKAAKEKEKERKRKKKEAEEKERRESEGTIRRVLPSDVGRKARVFNI